MLKPVDAAMLAEVDEDFLSPPRIVRELTEADLAALGWLTPKPQPARGGLDTFGAGLSRKLGAPGVPKAKEFSRQASPSGIVSSVENVKLALAQINVVFRYDEFHRRVEIDGYPERPIGESLDTTVLKIRDWISGQFGFEPGSQHAHEAVQIVALQNAFDPVRDYLDGLRWDGVPRIDTWLTQYLGAEDDSLTRAIGRATLIAAVRRVRRPGCKFDFMLVLEGVQGTGKSTALHILAGEDDNFTDGLDFRMGAREVQEALEGKWIVEAPELHGLSRSDVQKVKGFISKTTDRARPAFGRNVVEARRRCVLVGTTNDQQYLKDETGNRRFWPVATGAVDLDALRADRDQLWAEAAAAEPLASEPVTIPEGLWGAARERQATRLAPDAWEEILAEGLEKYAKVIEGERRIKSQDIHPKILAPAGYPKAEPQRVSKCMQRLGWDGPKVVRWKEGPMRSYVKLVE